SLSVFLRSSFLPFLPLPPRFRGRFLGNPYLPFPFLWPRVPVLRAYDNRGECARSPIRQVLRDRVAHCVRLQWLESVRRVWFESRPCRDSACSGSRTPLKMLRSSCPC